MKRENLYVVGAALLASTSLSTAASAATFMLAATHNQGGTFSTTARPLSAQSFASTPSTAQVLGPRTLIVRFASPIQADNTNITVTLAGARFVTSSIPSRVEFLQISAGVSLVSSGAGSGTLGTQLCAVQAQTDRLVITGCHPATSSGQTSIAGIFLSNVTFDNATGLATAGTSVTLASEVTIGTTVLETTAATAIITSRNALSGTSTSNAAIGQANVSSNPAFAQIVGSGLSAVIGTINITQAGSIAADLTTQVVAAGATGATEIRITTPIITGAGFTNVKTVGGTTGTLTRGLTQAASGSVTFTIAAASVQEETTVSVEFNGTTAIDVAAAGTTGISFSSAGAQSQTANSGVIPAVAGTVSGIARSGLSVDINGVQPGTAQGAVTYTSLLRIVNTGSAAGTITAIVRNEATGATLGTYTSPSIPAGAALQVSAAQIEAGAGITAQASILYRMSVSGSINGYVQHVNWNQTAGFFSDLSGRRNSTNGTNN
jgi:hypothetical protein